MLPHTYDALLDAIDALALRAQSAEQRAERAEKVGKMRTVCDQLLGPNLMPNEFEVAARYYRGDAVICQHMILMSEPDRRVGGSEAELLMHALVVIAR